MKSVLMAVLMVLASGPETPDFSQLLAQGEEHLKQGLLQQALNDFSEVLKSEPKNAGANLGRARALLGLGDGPKAIGPARLAAELMPQNAAAIMVLGDAYAHDATQDFPRAAQAYKQVLELEPTNRDAGLRLARALSFQKEVEQAIDVLENVLQHHPEDVILMVKLAESYYAIRKLDRAVGLLDRALKLQPGHPEALRVQEQVRSRKAYNFWVPIIAIIAFPLIYLLVRFMRKGRVPKVPEA